MQNFLNYGNDFIVITLGQCNLSFFDWNCIDTFWSRMIISVIYLCLYGYFQKLLIFLLISKPLWPNHCYIMFFHFLVRYEDWRSQKITLGHPIGKVNKVINKNWRFYKKMSLYFEPVLPMSQKITLKSWLLMSEINKIKRHN